VVRPSASEQSPDAVSLVRAAALGTLPRHQYMDHETWTWIATNRPAVAAAPSGDPLRLEFPADRVAVPAPWHLEPATVDSIHGTRHLMRTAVNATLLATHLGLPPDARTAALIAGAIHDCRRAHDQDDPGHGARAADWFLGHLNAVTDHFGLPLDGAWPERIATAVALHDIAYEQFGDVEQRQHESAGPIVDVLKAADALDRYRQPKLKWWPNDDRLRIVPPAWLKSFAYRLVLRSEANHLAGFPSDRSVIAALHREGTT
jgi:hypothetical protein